MEDTLVNDYFKSFRKETHILLVDNDMIYLDLLAGVLKYFSYKVTIAKSGQDALSLLSNGSGKFDLILIDAGLIYANSSFLLRELVTKEVPLILMGSDNECSVSATDILRNGAYYYIKKPIPLENIRNMWVHATEAKFPKSNVENNGKQVLQINSPEKNETINYDNSKGAKGKEIAINGMIAGSGTTDSTRNRSWNIPFTFNSYQSGHEVCSSKDLERMNDEHDRFMQVASLGQGPINRSMPVDIPQQLLSQENFWALMAYQNPLAENHVDNDNHIDAYLENIFLNDGIFDTSLEDIPPLPPNFGMIPNSNELINNQLPPGMENESIPSWIESILFD